MQFEFSHKIGRDYVQVVFNEKMASVKGPAIFELWETFKRIGGNSGLAFEGWTFPTFVTSQLISEIIHNTCFVCGGFMENGIAFKNSDVVEIPNGLSMTSHVWKEQGPAKQINVRKCSQCGHSHT